jgi:hypothetical protein
MSIIITIFDLITNTYTQMKSGQLIKDYYLGVDDLQRQKTLLKRTVMECMKGEIELQVGVYGWKPKGKGGVTETMISTSTFTMEYVKVFNGETVTMKLKVNIGDDYDKTGYKEMILKGSKLIPDRGWWNNSKGNGSHFDFITGVNDHIKFNLNSQLELINETYNN